MIQTVRISYRKKIQQKLTQGKHMSNPLEKMTNQELMNYCIEEGIEVESKNVSKPTKKELLTAIKNAAATSIVDGVEEEPEMTDADEFLNEGEPDGLQEKEESKTKEVKKKLTRAQKRRMQHDMLMPLRRVIITTNADNQTKTNLEFITWGNGLIGHHTDRVYLNKPWHVREGALRNMRNAIITESVQNEEENRVDTVTKPAYNIQMLDPLTKEEIERIGKRQVIRDASIESLI